MPRASKPERRFTVAWDGRRDRWIAQDENGDLLGVDRTLDCAIGSAVREANLASRAGCRVVVDLEDKNGKRSREYTAQPPPA